MLSDVMEYFGLTRDFRGVGYLKLRTINKYSRNLK
ncbi:hypothetical protein BHECKSOX_581 [Bathymodiolus heckerae thiotrophic gill symbiont]|nr:hypothetical protein BHECKSOX_581 [Bathymodiolus heckerae thiotrophic gill symbiont]